MIFESELLATENAAMIAFMLCQDFSRNNGMFPECIPSFFKSYGVQGLLPAIGKERRRGR